MISTEESMCWIFLFATLVSLFYHQKMIVDLLKVYSETYGNSTINSIFRIERLLQDKRGVILYTCEEDGEKYEIIKHKIEESERDE